MQDEIIFDLSGLIKIILVVSFFAIISCDFPINSRKDKANNHSEIRHQGQDVIRASHQSIQVFLQDSISIDSLHNVLKNKGIKTLEITGVFLGLAKLPDDLCNLYQLDSLGIMNCGVEELPSCLANISTLKKLDIRGNRLKGIPKFFEDMKNLEELNLERSFHFIDFSRDIAHLKPLKRLKKLHLSWVPMSTFPKDIANLTSLETLKLKRNKFLLKERENTILNSLTNLRNLSIDHLEIKFLQPNRLKKLEKLRLVDNKLTFFPKTLCTLSSLKYLTLAYNPIASVPEAIGELKLLKSLLLAKCQLQELPASITKLVNLEVLDISKNDLKRLPQDIGNLSKLKRLYLYNNDFSEEEIERIKKALPNTKID